MSNGKNSLTFHGPSLSPSSGHLMMGDALMMGTEMVLKHWRVFTI
jgi:hypothetical protein